MENSKSFSQQLAWDISHSSLVDEFKKSTLQLRLHELEDQALNIMVVGPKGVGKTSTIKAVFGNRLNEEFNAVSGITRFQNGNLVVWDYPGHNGDEQHDKMLDMQIGATLSESDSDGNPLIDMAVVVLDPAEQNLNQGYRLICDVIAPALGSNFDNRLVVGLNKVDIASFSYEWDFLNDSPSNEVEIWPESTAALIRHCMLDESGLEIAPVCYAADFERTNGEGRRPFNTIKLLNQIVAKLPAAKQITLIDTPLNQQSQAWFDSDDRMNYVVEVENSLFDSIYQGSRGGSRFGGLLGAYMGKQGREIGYLIRRNLHNRLNLA
ncbi:hypothetical protein [Grimontia sp. NTOU-MAR1]|uniref:hypothetical protein n=1 Tax=Grimontia sp. NTOU-MAR1 TaxID=3111011 RepID=UPI002DBE95F2|nr:hypothetical protein [Grimontia sp. NTOU-MAR1]WRW00499.1 hypothetical protein VP504_18755 [Grimontia sp. NTOU-MAR1]